MLRVYGAQMVQEGGILLKCPQVVMATGQILLQRFYCKRSLKDFSVKVKAGHGGMREAPAHPAAFLLFFMFDLATCSMFLLVKCVA